MWRGRGLAGAATSFASRWCLPDALARRVCLFSTDPTNPVLLLLFLQMHRITLPHGVRDSNADIVAYPYCRLTLTVSAECSPALCFAAEPAHFAFAFPNSRESASGQNSHRLAVCTPGPFRASRSSSLHDTTARASAST